MKFLTLVKQEYNAIFTPLLIIAGMMAVMQLMFIFTAMGGASVHDPLSHVLGEGSLLFFFLLGVAGLAGLIGARMILHFTPSKSMYALLTLPVSRAQVYLAKLMTYWLAALVLIAVQLLLILLFDRMAGLLMLDTAIYRTGIEGSANTYLSGRRGADLYLTILENDFLRIIAPTQLLSILMSITAIGGSVCVVLFVSAAVKARRFISPIISSAIWLGLVVITFPLANSTNGASFVILFFMLVTAVVTTLMGMDLFESGEVTG